MQLLQKSNGHYRRGGGGGGCGSFVRPQGGSSVQRSGAAASQSHRRFRTSGSRSCAAHGLQASGFHPNQTLHQLISLFFIRRGAGE